MLHGGFPNVVDMHQGRVLQNLLRAPPRWPLQCLRKSFGRQIYFIGSDDDLRIHFINGCLEHILSVERQLVIN